MSDVIRPKNFAHVVYRSFRGKPARRRNPTKKLLAARERSILFQVEDVEGGTWGVKQARETKHGFDLLFGVPVDHGSYRGGLARLIATKELTDFWDGNRTRHDGFLFDLPEEHMLDHLEALCFGRTDRAVLEVYAHGLHDIDRWLTSLGGSTVAFEPPPMRLPAPFPSWPHLEAGRHIRYRVVAGGDGRRGEALWSVLHAAVSARNIPVHFDTAASGVHLFDDSGLRMAGGPP